MPAAKSIVNKAPKKKDPLKQRTTNAAPKKPGTKPPIKRKSKAPASTLNTPPEAVRPKKGKTHSGQKAALIVVRPRLKGIHEELKTAVVAWGRMNPPTVGHEALVDAVASIAEEVGGVPLLCLSNTVNAKNPLTLSERMVLVEEAFGDKIYTIDEASIKDPISLFAHIAEHYDNIVVVTGEEHEADYLRMLSVYNGSEFVFEDAEVVVLERNAKSEVLSENISATKMREYAQDGNFESFKEGLPANLPAQEVFEQLRYSMTLQNLLVSESTTIETKVLQSIVEYRNRNV